MRLAIIPARPHPAAVRLCGLQHLVAVPGLATKSAASGAGYNRDVPVIVGKIGPS